MTMPTSPSRPDAYPAEHPTSVATDVHVIALSSHRRWHDPLHLIERTEPGHSGRIVLWTVSLLVLALIVWAAVGRLDIIATAEGKLAPQTLVKIVQPAEAGVVTHLLVAEGDSVQAGQVLARLDATLAHAEQAGVSHDLAAQQMQVRRIDAELQGQPMRAQAGDDRGLYALVQRQYAGHRRAYLDNLDLEKFLLMKAEHEQKSAMEILEKLEQTLPAYQQSAQAYTQLESDGFVGRLAAADKTRDAQEKSKDRDAQRATVAALDASFAAQQKKISQLRSSYQSELQKELADLHAKIAQLQPNLDKTMYREGLMALRAPQDGVIKDVATTTIGAVVQPGTVVMTLVPRGEPLFADVNIKNEDVGFVQVGQKAQIKLAAYPFQQYGMLAGRVVHISADATEVGKTAAPTPSTGTGPPDSGNPVPAGATYKARIQLERQILTDPQQHRLSITPGMQVVAEINQGNRTVLAYLLSPVQKAVAEAGRER